MLRDSELINNIIILWRYLGKKRRNQFIVLFILMLVSVFAEVITIGAVIPFLGVLTSPEHLFKLSWIKPLVGILEVESSEELLLPLTLAFILIAIFSSAIRISQLWYNSRLTAAMGTQLRHDIYVMALNKPYEFHLAHNSSDLISLTTEKVGAAISVGIMQVLFLLTALVMSLAIVTTLIYINPFVALIAFISWGGGYILIARLVRKKVRKNSDVIRENQPQAVKCMQEGLGGIRDVILDNSQEVFSQGYAKTVRKVQYAAVQNSFLSTVPKNLLEVLGITLIALLAYAMQIGPSSGQNALPLLGAFALGAQRLLPGLQQIYYSWSLINGNHAVLADVTAWVDKAGHEAKPHNNLVPSLDFSRSIELCNIIFRYVGTDKEVLSNIRLTIPKGSRIGFIGATGSGKSTLLDLIMGLLVPTEGQLRIDGKKIDSVNVKAWQQNIAHVSQAIFLADGSMLENIAFGVLIENIDKKQVEKAARLAQIHDFIEDLPNGYQTLVGERGVRLSGGQRQRIGIARALYKKAEVLVLDEATSALDDTTEKAVMAAIDKLDGDLTVLIIAHRLSTLDGCDTVVELAQGRIIRKGTYVEMIGEVIPALSTRPKLF
ncbi:MAG: ABC transporter ATP-binding protein [Candidatus Electrothrix sp. GM3_4]|nr:ABC transporter ATP-binding protein [Candidatus Electrothrix sp. GM3_4]